MTNVNSNVNKPKTTTTKSKSTTSRTKKKDPPPKKYCPHCQRERAIRDYFYSASDNLIHVDGKLPLCKSCLTALIDMNNITNVLDILRRIDKPFLIDKYKQSLSHDNPFSAYMTAISLPQYGGWNYTNSSFDEDLSKYKAKDERDINKTEAVDELASFKVTTDLVIKWGAGYKANEVFQLERLYNDMKNRNVMETSEDIEIVKLLCKMNLKMNQYLDDGQINDFKNLSGTYQNTLKDAGLRRIDRKGSAESMGINSFSQVAEELEKNGFIPKYEPKPEQSILDATILHLENYTRRFLNMQTVSEPTGDTPKVVDYYDDEE